MTAIGRQSAAGAASIAHALTGRRENQRMELRCQELRCPVPGTFQEESRNFLNRYGIEFDEQYIWEL